MEEKEIRELVAQALADEMATAGEQFKSLATEAAETAVSALKGQVIELGERLDATLAGSGGEAMTAEQVGEIVNQRLAETETQRAERQAGEAAKKKVVDARKAFIDSQASGVPTAYHSHIPETDDEAELAKGLEAAVAAFRADVGSGQYGVRATDLGASAPSGAGDVTTLDPEKMTATQKIQAGLQKQQ